MSIYGHIFQWILIFSISPTFLALIDGVMMPVVANGKNTLRNFCIITVMCIASPCAVLGVIELTKRITLLISNDYIRVVIYTIILTVVSNEKLYIPWKEAKRFQKNLLREFSKRFFTYLPIKTILYLISAMCLVASQLQELGIYRLSEFWSEFSSYHEYALLLVFSVNEIVNYLIDDLKRVFEIRKLEDKSLRGFESYPRMLKENKPERNVYICACKSDKKIAAELVALLKENSVECWDMCTKFYDVKEVCRYKAVEQSRVFVLIVSEDTMDKKSGIMFDIINALEMKSKNKTEIIIYKLTDRPYSEDFEMVLEHIPESNIYRSDKDYSDTQIPSSLVNRISELADNKNGHEYKEN